MMRPMTADDGERVLAWRNSPDVRAYMYTDHLISPDEHARWLDGALADPRRRYWIVEADGRPVGLANLYDIDERHRRCAWAYYLADPAARGRGLGSAVEFFVIEQVFGPMGLAKLWCEVLASNDPVWRLHLKHGFREEARLRRHVLKNGEWQDVLGLGLLAEEWAERRGEMAERLRRKGHSPFPLDGGRAGDGGGSVPG